MNKQRINAIDVIKAYAIIIVVAFHMKIMPMGYLGVDVFLVVNGYLLANHFKRLSTLKDSVNFLSSRIARLWPIVIVSTAFCLIWGAVWLLPFTYRILIQNIIATNLFANNILLYLTTVDYWNIGNDYNPLMHTWYLGVLVQFYFAIVVILYLFKKILPVRWDSTSIILFICFSVSLVCFFAYPAKESYKFYCVTFRFFEVCLGALVALFFKNRPPFTNTKVSSIVVLASFTSLVAFFIIGGTTIPSVDLLMTCVLTAIMLPGLPYIGGQLNFLFNNKVFAAIGKASLSVYIWHQIVLGFYRNIVPDLEVLGIFIVIAFTVLLSVVSYHILEVKLPKYVQTRLSDMKLNLICASVFIPVMGVSIYFYSISGVLRDVPELGITTSNLSLGMNSEYNESARQYDKNFSCRERMHWLVIGDSFGRDWCNILKEAGVEKYVELSYSSGRPDERIKKADLIFRTMSTTPEYHVADAAAFVKDMTSMGIPLSKVFIVGGKHFGNCNHEYCSRFWANYPDVSAISEIEKKHFVYNDEMRRIYKNHYIDLMTPVTVDGKFIRMYTDDVKFISHDCVHLTSFGAKYYAALLKENIDKLLQYSRGGD